MGQNVRPVLTVLNLNCPNVGILAREDLSDDDFLPVSSGRLLIDFNHQVTNDDVVF